jgi:hypothetical protein
MELLYAFAHAAAWILGLTLLFAVIGFIATIRWIIGLFSRGGQAVASEVKQIGDSMHKQ